MQPDHPPAITQGIEAGNPCDSHMSMKEELQNAWSIDHHIKTKPISLETDSQKQDGKQEV